MNENHAYAGCIVHQNTGEDPYLYVVGGNDAHVEKMNLNNFTRGGNGWELVGTGQVLDEPWQTGDASTNFDAAEDYGLFIKDQFIYIVCGYDTTWENDVTVIDTINETVVWDHDIKEGIRGLKAQLSCCIVWVVDAMLVRVVRKRFLIQFVF